MLKLLSQKNIKENWKTYKPQIEKAFTSSEGSHLITSTESVDIYKTIYGRPVSYTHLTLPTTPYV